MAAQSNKATSMPLFIDGDAIDQVVIAPERVIELIREREEHIEFIRLHRQHPRERDLLGAAEHGRIEALFEAGVIDQQYHIALMELLTAATESDEL